MRRVCDKLGLKFGRCIDDAKAVLKEKGVSEPTNAQLKKTMDKIKEQHHTILFLYKSNKSCYGKLIKQMDKDMLQRKDPLPNLSLMQAIYW